MKASDDLLSVQGTVRTLVDADGYLVREDSLNGRTRYPVKDDDTKYTAGSGLVLSGNTFSIDNTVALKSDLFSGSYNDLTDKPTIPTKVSELQNDSGFISGYTETDPIFSSISGNLVQLNQQGKIPTSLYGTNKHNIIVNSTPITGTFELGYNPNFEVFINEITLSSNTLDIGQIDFTEYSLNAGETATLENWLTFTNQDDAETISINSNISNVGDIPETLSGTQIHVFVRRVYKDSNNNIHEAISYAYSF